MTSSRERFRSFYLAASDPGVAVEAPACPVCPTCPPRRRHGATTIDAIVGLGVRLAIAAELWSWSRANALPARDWTDWQAWVTPDPGLVVASARWLPGFINAEFVAFSILCVVTALALSTLTGFLARIAGLALLAGAAAYGIFVLPEAWTSALLYGALGLYLTLRGAGPLSIDFATTRLSRLA